MGATGHGVRARGYGNPCDFGITPVPIGIGFGTAYGLGLGLRGPDLGLGLDNNDGDVNDDRGTPPKQPNTQSDIWLTSEPGS